MLPKILELVTAVIILCFIYILNIPFLFIAGMCWQLHVISLSVSPSVSYFLHSLVIWSVCFQSFVWRTCVFACESAEASVFTNYNLWEQVVLTADCFCVTYESWRAAANIRFSFVRRIRCYCILSYHVFFAEVYHFLSFHYSLEDIWISLLVSAFVYHSVLGGAI